LLRFVCSLTLKLLLNKKLQFIWKTCSFVA
jgi:hypothetical protein